MALSEHETRGQLIDRQLVQAGWRLDDLTQVRREVPADHAVRETSETAYGSAVSGGITMTYRCAPLWRAKRNRGHGPSWNSYARLLVVTKRHDLNARQAVLQ